MSILNPCCCITLRTGAKTVATVDIIVALILLIIFLSDLMLTISQNGFESSQYIYVTSGVWTIMTVFLATNVGISTLLYTGARNYSIKRCKWWFYIQTVITSVAFIVLILILCFKLSFDLLVLDLLHLLYRFYTLWVVYLFIGELTYLDTLCSLNKNKKPTGVFVYDPQTGVPQTQTYPPQYTSSTAVTSPNSAYHHTPYPFTHEEWPVDTGSIGAVGHPHYSSDDGFPSNQQRGGGGIDNPTYLP